jgi:uncharacterized membrane protein YeaQ/YmgE (transglycosylase-associated protein family)
MNMTFEQVVGWIIAGLIVGAIARLLIPGRQEMGIVMTIILGIVGAFVGGLIAAQLFGPPPPEISVDTHWRGWLMSILGGVLVVGAYAFLTKQIRHS